MGFWQLQRAAEKEAALSLFDQQLLLPPAGWESFESNPQQYQLLKLTGNYAANSDWLLDNQIYQGQFGYRVFTPFCSDRNCILVDRGWTKGDLDRRILPNVGEQVGTVTISGRLDKLSQNSAIGKDEPLTVAPFRVQQINFDTVSIHLLKYDREHTNISDNPAYSLPAKKLYPWIMRLESEQPGHFIVSWKPVVTGPEKHYGYAFQWFAMAIALIILLLVTTFKKRMQPDS
jgi:surfeit locus 1 family protein